MDKQQKNHIDDSIEDFLKFSIGEENIIIKAVRYRLRKKKNKHVLTTDNELYEFFDDVYIEDMKKIEKRKIEENSRLRNYIDDKGNCESISLMNNKKCPFIYKEGDKNIYRLSITPNHKCFPLIHLSSEMNNEASEYVFSAFENISKLPVSNDAMILLQKGQKRPLIGCEIYQSSFEDFDDDIDKMIAQASSNLAAEFDKLTVKRYIKHGEEGIGAFVASDLNEIGKNCRYINRFYNYMKEKSDYNNMNSYLRYKTDEFIEDILKMKRNLNRPYSSDLLEEFKKTYSLKNKKSTDE